MSPTFKAMLLEMFAELVRTSPQIDYELAQLYAKPARTKADWLAIAKRIREDAHNDCPKV